MFAIGLKSTIHTWVLRMKGPVYVSMFKPLGMVIAIFMGVTLLGDVLHLGRYLLNFNLYHLFKNDLGVYIYVYICSKHWVGTLWSTDLHKLLLTFRHLHKYFLYYVTAWSFVTSQYILLFDKQKLSSFAHCLISKFALILCSVVGAGVIALGFYAVIWGQAKEDKNKVEDSNKCHSFESSSHTVPLLQDKTMEI